jgi:hypothetical protein
MRSNHWNKRARHIPKSNLPGCYRLAYHEIGRLIARLVCIVHAKPKAALQSGCKKPSREDDRKEGRQARRLRARRWVPGCCCGMRSRRTEPSAMSAVNHQFRLAVRLTETFASASRTLSGWVRVSSRSPTPNRSRERGRSPGKPPLSDDDQWPLCANSGHKPAAWRTGQIDRGCAKTLTGSAGPPNFEAYRLAEREKS